MIYKKIFFAASIAASLTLTGCGSDNNSSTSTSSSSLGSISQGRFVDDPVDGLYYETSPSNHSGITHDGGKFDYVNGDVVTFYLGGKKGLKIGSADAQKNVTPFETANSFDEAAAIAQILQTLDDGGNGVIKIIDTMIPGTKAYDSKLVNDVSNIDLGKIIAGSTTIAGRTLISKQEALKKMRDSVEKLADEADEDGSAVNLSNWNAGPNTYLAIIFKPTDEDKNVVNIDETLPDNVVTFMKKALDVSVLKMGTKKVSATDRILKPASGDLAKYLLSCKIDNGKFSTQKDKDSNDEKASYCDGSVINNIKEELSKAKYLVHIPYDFNDDDEFIKIKQGQLWKDFDMIPTLKCMEDGSCTTENIDGWDIATTKTTTKDEINTTINTTINNRYVTYSASSDTLYLIKKNQDTTTVNNQETKSESSNVNGVAYLINNELADRFIDFKGVWQVEEKRVGCSPVAKRTYTFDTKSVTVEGQYYPNVIMGNHARNIHDELCQLNDIKKENLSLSSNQNLNQLKQWDNFWWINQNGSDRTTKATLAQLNLVIRSYMEKVNRGPSNDRTITDAFSYTPMGKNWDQGTLYKNTRVDENPQIVATTKYSKVL